MKIYKYLNPYSSIRSFTTLSSLTLLSLSTSYAVIVSDTMTDLSTPILGTDSAYQLLEEEPSGDELFNITKYHRDSLTDELTPVHYNVVFEEELGDAGGDTLLHYKWVEKVDALRSYMALEVATELDADLSVRVDSSLNKPFDYLSVETDIYNSFSGQDYTETDFIAVVDVFGANIGDVHGDFVAIQGREGSAIRLYERGTIDDIKGNFVGNSARGFGGAIYANGDIKNITGDFIANSSGEDGGAIMLTNHTIDGELVHGRIDTIKGDFIANHSVYLGGAISVSSASIGTIEGDFIANTSEGGGAISVFYSTIANLTGDFIGNSAYAMGKDFSYIGKGGALLVSLSSSVGLLALDKSVEFTGNTTEGKSYGIHLRGYATKEANINMNSFSNNTITINDGIVGEEPFADYKTININNGINGVGAQYGRTDYSTVAFNNTVTDLTVNVHNGTLKLGEFAGITLNVLGNAKEVAASQALLNGIELNVSSGATVEAYSGAALGDSSTSNLITNKGIIGFGKGVLLNDMNMLDGGTLALTGTGSTASTINAAGTGNKITGTGRETEVAGTLNIAAGATLDIENTGFSADTIVNNSAAKADVTLTNGIITDINLGARTTLDGVASSTLAGYDGSAEIIDIHIYDMLNVGTELNALTLEGSITFDITLSGDDIAHFESLQLPEIDDQYFIFQYGEGDDAFGDEYMTSLEGLDVYLNINGVTYQADYNFENGVGSLAMAFAVPEPSTATMSLLALASLLARRRRRVA